MNQRNLGIIPARGGSKGVYRKNIRLVCGQPLIAYTIKAAKESLLLTDFVTTTDDPEIEQVAKSFDSPIILRPPELAADKTPMIPVVRHVLETLPEKYDNLVLLQPTSPLRNSQDIDAALRQLNESGADSIVSVYQVEDHHPSRMYRLDNDVLIPYETESERRLRQELPSVYHRNGAIYACRTSLVLERNTLLGNHLRPYIMPRDRSVNIDDELDLAFAEFLLLRR